MNTIDRYPAVAGQFYPSDPIKLQLEVARLLQEAEPKQCSHTRAIICPHAGYVYSGVVAASAFNQIDSEVMYRRIILIASSHNDYFDKASVYCEGDYVMPYGKVMVDTSFANELVELFPGTFSANRSPHLHEHSLEVQLPFLHYALKTHYQIVPILIGTNNPDVCQRIAAALKPYMTKENLFVISSDFSHYPNYTDAKRVDAITKDAILTNDPEALLVTLAENSTKHIPHLSTSLCGWTSVLTLLYMTENNASLEYRAIKYRNSGDVEMYGDLERVVGYWGIVVCQKQIDDKNFKLSDADKKALLNIAQKTIEEHCLTGKKYAFNTAELSDMLIKSCGAFVTLHKKGALRGCIGRVVGDMPLYQTVQDMALSAASQDYRFLPVEASELPDINIEISVLSPLKKIDDVADIKLGKHGIFIEKNHNTGLFLPQVATETGWSKEEFLGHCCRDKAGLDWDAWKTANVYVFTATVF